MRTSLVSLVVAVSAVLGAAAPAAAATPAPAVVSPGTGVVLASPCCKQAIR